jgi:shikimate dehydrogenase
LNVDVYCILGFPIGHSRSPAMHNRAFEKLGIAAHYVPFAVAPESLPDAVRGVRALGIRGFNVTVPHKIAIMPWLDEIDAVARDVGAVNTVVREGGHLRGTNTDAEGLTRALREVGASLAGARATVLGAGGAARASVVGLARAGVAKIHVAARQPERADALVSDLRASLQNVTLDASDLGITSLGSAFAQTDLLVQATSATLDGTPAAERFTNGLPLDLLPPSALVTDLVYKPLKTSLLRAAEARGLTTLDGLGMLLHQGALAFELWTGQSAPIDSMRAALSDASRV